ncbi:hypothetical protein SMKI_13G3410 [Saccharomyces mikatae IFO 1815]|uniref:Esc1p n=1 Tax=Saccharomyces mikatae IFO 1815 TaxID=226126 RepID=A0AA35IUG3_SACMI|nr:uncharacterized protein SMKI_13G3410 [Saccharomyces mikatae IFO 1815]CAI4035690.1 hypothetical protein SMKI_13G3410 [Saccharomyces mikatae IFO 1815]
MPEKEDTSKSTANPLNLTTPRRKLKILSSLLDAKECHSTQNQHNYPSRNINKYKVAKPTRQSLLRETVSFRRSDHIRNKSLHEDSTKALDWVGSLINRGKSILTTLEDEDALFERELEEERQRFQLHESLMNKYTESSKSHQRLIDLRKHQYGTDTSFQNNDEIPLDSFISSPLPEADDNTPSNIDSDADEDLKGNQPSINSFSLGSSESDFSGKEENTDNQSDSSIVIISDQEYKEEETPQGISSEDEYDVQEEKKSSMREIERVSEDGDGMQNNYEKDEEELEGSIDFSKYMQPKTGNIDNSVIVEGESSQRQNCEDYSKNGALYSGSVNISVEDESGDEEDQTGSYSTNDEIIHYPNQKELDNKKLINNSQSLANEQEDTDNITEYENPSFENDIFIQSEREQQESDGQSENCDIINFSSDEYSYQNNSGDEYSEKALKDDVEPVIEEGEQHTVDRKDNEVDAHSVGSNLHQQKQIIEISPNNLYDLATRAILQMQQSESSFRSQREEKVSGSDQEHSGRVDVLTTSSEDVEVQPTSQKVTSCYPRNEKVKVDQDGTRPFDDVMYEKTSEKRVNSATEESSSSLSTDKGLNKSSIVTEDSVYYSLDDIDVVPENLIDAPFLEHQAAFGYEVVFTGSVYSSTSSEDNAEVMPQEVDYVSPFINDPFCLSNDDCEENNEILTSTLAALTPAFDDKEAKVRGSGTMQSCSISKSEGTNILPASRKSKQMSDSDEITETANFKEGNTHDEKEKDDEIFSTMAISADKSIDDNMDEKYFSAVNYTNITEDSSFQEVIEPATDVEETSSLYVESANKVENSSGNENGEKNENVNTTQDKFVADPPENYQRSVNGINFSSVELITKDEDLGEELPENNPANHEVHPGMDFEKQHQGRSSQNSLHEENDTNLEDNHEVHDSRHGHDEEYEKVFDEKDLTGPEFGHTENRKDSTTIGTKKGVPGFIKREKEAAYANYEEEVLSKTTNASSSVDIHSNSVLNENFDQEENPKYEEIEEKIIIQNVNTNEAQFSIIETFDEVVTENKTKNLEKSCIEERHHDVLSGTKTTIFGNKHEEKPNMHNIVSQFPPDFEQKYDRTTEHNFGDSTKDNVEIPVSNTESHPDDRLRPESNHTSVFSSPIRVFETVAKGVGKVVDLAESFVKKIDVMDSESDDENEEDLERKVPSNTSDNIESIVINERDSDEDEESTFEEAIPKIPSGDNNSHAIRIDAEKNDNNERESCLGSYSDVSEKELKDKRSLQDSKGSPANGLLLEKHEQNENRNQEGEDEEPIYGEKTSVNTHVSDLNDIKRQKLLKNLSDLQYYSQRLTHGFGRGTTQEESKVINTSAHQDFTFENSDENEYARVIEEDSVSELDISNQFTTYEEHIPKKQDKSIDELHSEPEEGELFVLESKGPTQKETFCKSDVDGEQLGIPSTDLPSDPPSDREGTAGFYANLNSDNAATEMNVRTSPEVYEIFSDTPNEAPIEIGDQSPNSVLGKGNATTMTPVLDGKSEDTVNHDVVNEASDNFINIKVTEAEEPEAQAVDIPIEVDVKEEQEKMSSNSNLDEQKLNTEQSNDVEELGINSAEEINRRGDKVKAKKKSRKRNYNNRRRKRKITEDSPATSNSKRLKKHEAKERGKNTHRSANK